MRRGSTNDGEDYENKRPVTPGEVQCQLNSPYPEYSRYEGNVNHTFGLFTGKILVHGTVNQSRRGLNKPHRRANRHALQSIRMSRTEQYFPPRPRPSLDPHKQNP